MIRLFLITTSDSVRVKDGLSSIADPSIMGKELPCAIGISLVLFLDYFALFRKLHGILLAIYAWFHALEFDFTTLINKNGCQFLNL